jgi:trigger factor
MQIQVEDVSPVEKKLAVEIPWDRVREKLDHAYKELGRGVQLRGFRKGKVPRSVLERMFGKQVQLEVAKELVQESFLHAAREHKLEPVAEPVVEDAAIRPGENFKYSARVEIRAPVEVKDWAGLLLERRPVEVADQEVEHALEHKRLMQTEYKAIEGRKESAASDVLIVSLKGTVGEFPVDRPEVTIDLGDAAHEPLPGMVNALLGIPVDAKDHAITLEVPADTPQKEIAGKTAKLSVTIRDIREKQVPALDDEFAKDTGEADTLEDLKTKLRADLAKQAGERIDREVRQAALKALVAKNPVAVAPALVERGIDSQLERTRLSLMMQGIDMDKSGVDTQSLREKLRDTAAEEIRGQLILEALADAENLAVTDEEMNAKIAEMAVAREKTPAKMRAELDREGSLDSLRWRLRQEKALDLVVSRATITEVSGGKP